MVIVLFMQCLVALVFRRVLLRYCRRLLPLPRWEDSLVVPRRVPMVVLYKRPPFLLVAFDTFTGREGRVRLHRNSVSVVERLSWLDVTLATAAR